jgi:pilus assembly protein CpaD
MKVAGKLAVVLAVACGLTACADRTNKKAVSSIPSDNHPISASPKEAVLVLDGLTEQRTRHDTALNARVGAFTYDFVNRSSSTLQVLVGAGTADDAQATEIARDAVRVLVRHGVPASRMDVKVVSGTNSIKPGTVVMRYTQWVAKPPECGGVTENVAIDYDNLPTPNLGCSIQRNIAAMVANPRDLNQPEPVETREGAPGEAVMRHFRRGEETHSFEWKEVQFGK